MLEGPILFLIGGVVVAATLFGLSQTKKPLPPPPANSFANYLSELERMSMQTQTDRDLCVLLALERGWQPDESCQQLVEEEEPEEEEPEEEDEDEDEEWVIWAPIW